MNKTEIASHLTMDLSLTMAEPGRMVAAVTAAIGDALARDESVTIAGVGTFCIHEDPRSRARMQSPYGRGDRHRRLAGGRVQGGQGPASGRKQVARVNTGPCIRNRVKGEEA